MITTRQGDLLEQVDLELIAHQTNCKGSMGAGIAKQIRARYPQTYEPYRKACHTNGADLLGTFMAVSTDGKRVRMNRLVKGDCCMIVNLFGQNGYGTRRPQTQYDKLEQALTKLRDEMVARGIRTVGVPKYLGCGLAGGNWNTVYNILHRLFAYENRIELVIVALA